MSLKNLSTEAMVSVTAAWVEAGPERNLLQGCPKLAPLLPDVEAAHQNLLATQAGPEQQNAALAELQKQEADADALHDRKLRGIFNLLTGLADLADEPSEAQKHLALRDRLFPEGLAGVRGSYLAEAGSVELAGERLTDADRDLARALPVLQGSLQQQIERWIEAGKNLGALERKRSTVSGVPGPTRADAARARNAWINVMNLFVGASGLEKKLDPQGREAIFGLLERAQASAEHRKGSDGSSTPAGSPAPPAAPKPTPAGGASGSAPKA